MCAVITTILGTDQATNSRSVINTNFSNLNTDKYESGDSPTFATTYSPILIGGTSTTSSLTYKTTTGVGTTGADHIFLVGNNGATEAMRILNNGNIVLGAQSALATNATDGFTYIPTSAGTPTGVPTSYTGKVAMEYDTTNNKLYIYNGAWKSVTLA